MCGIAGFCNSDRNRQQQIRLMTDAVRHRGPDSEGTWISDDGRVVFGHRRLAILDCTINGSQPMKSASGRFVISYNGEIYNHLKLRVELEGNGVVFRGTSDTETLVEAFDRYGVDRTLEKIKGMFAIALYDCKEQFLYLIRDRVGEKPLYYGTWNGVFLFASDLGSFEAFTDKSLEIDRGSVELFFRRGFIPTPFSIYKDIWKVEPGHYIRIGYPFLDWKNIAYWSAIEVSLSKSHNPFPGSYEDAVEELERLLKDSIKEQMISDVPLGAFLSAGIDSTTVVSLMQSISSQPIRTFTIGIKDGGNHNEAPIAKEVSAILGTDHTEEYISTSEIMSEIPHVAEIYTEPHGDSSQIPTSIISRIARKDVTVMLSGDGGDELFCGYERYYRWIIDEWKKQKRFPQAIQSVRAGIMEMKGKGRTVKARRLRANSLQQLYSAVFAWDSSFVNTDHIYNDLSDTLDTSGLHANYDVLMQMDFQEYMTDDILAKVDRAAMHHSLETRIPLLDKDVVEFAWSLPLDMKFTNGGTKRILRSILYKYVPRELLERPKSGFSIPLKEWLNTGTLREWAESVINEEMLSKQDYLDKNDIMKMWTDYVDRNVWTDSIWYVLVFLSWKSNREMC